MRMFDMLTNEDIKRIKKVEDPAKRIKELEDKCRTAGRAMIELNIEYLTSVEENKKLKEEIEKLKADLSRAKEEHQYDNMVHQKELESLKNPTTHLRNKALI